MALDLSFKDLVDAVTRNPGIDGRPLFIPLSQIDEDRDQPRRVFNEDELAQLADSIRLVGILQPIVVRASARFRGVTSSSWARAGVGQRDLPASSLSARHRPRGMCARSLCANHRKHSA